MAAYALYKASSPDFDNREYVVIVTGKEKLYGYIKRYDKPLVKGRDYEPLINGLKFRGYLTEDAFHNLLFLDSI
tara:strand:- start:2356 stop:2577 length:222 start_codon:yes stop_codon:yes gene_type:complete